MFSFLENVTELIHLYLKEKWLLQRTEDKARHS